MKSYMSRTYNKRFTINVHWRYVIYPLGGPSREKLCPRSWMYRLKQQSVLCAFNIEGKVFLYLDQPKPVNDIFIFSLVISGLWIHNACIKITFIVGFTCEPCNKNPFKTSHPTEHENKHSFWKLLPRILSSTCKFTENGSKSSQVSQHSWPGL